ncbi:MAG: PIN/TRAM domain-containing protein [Candidatus Methylomirabilales bacterium]
MGGHSFRVLVLLLCGLTGIGIGWHYGADSGSSTAGLILGITFAAVGLILEWFFRRATLKGLLSGLVGFLIGLLLGRVLVDSLASLFTLFPPGVATLVQVLTVLVSGYVGGVVGVEKGRGISLVSLRRTLTERTGAGQNKILDTSVIIDGRIADICETGFIEGTLVVPPFVLRELQHIADSSDPIKRNRGRRGLDILQKIQKDPNVQVTIHELDFPEIREVDAKIVAMAKALQAKVLTNDFNLNKVAALHGVRVLNINELTNALRPVVLPGEEMRVSVLKEGKEYNQGVAYLDDGTMVVIDNGRRHIGQAIDVCVTSVLQTTAGRMIFSRLKEEAEAA